MAEVVGQAIRAFKVQDLQIFEALTAKTSAWHTLLRGGRLAIERTVCGIPFAERQQDPGDGSFPKFFSFVHGPR